MQPARLVVRVESAARRVQLTNLIVKSLQSPVIVNLEMPLCAYGERCAIEREKQISSVSEPLTLFSEPFQNPSTLQIHDKSVIRD